MQDIQECNDGNQQQNDQQDPQPQQGCGRIDQREGCETERTEQSLGPTVKLDILIFAGRITGTGKELTVENVKDREANLFQRVGNGLFTVKVERISKFFGISFHSGRNQCAEIGNRFQLITVLYGNGKGNGITISTCTCNAVDGVVVGLCRVNCGHGNGRCGHGELTVGYENRLAVGLGYHKLNRVVNQILCGNGNRDFFSDRCLGLVITDDYILIGNDGILDVGVLCSQRDSNHIFAVGGTDRLDHPLGHSFKKCGKREIVLRRILLDGHIGQKITDLFAILTYKLHSVIDGRPLCKHIDIGSAEIVIVDCTPAYRPLCLAVTLGSNSFDHRHSDRIVRRNCRKCESVTVDLTQTVLVGVSHLHGAVIVIDIIDVVGRTLQGNIEFGITGGHCKCLGQLVICVLKGGTVQCNIHDDIGINAVKLQIDHSSCGEVHSLTPCKACHGTVDYNAFLIDKACIQFVLVCNYEIREMYCLKGNKTFCGRGVHVLTAVCPHGINIGYLVCFCGCKRNGNLNGSSFVKVFLGSVGGNIECVEFHAVNTVINRVFKGLGNRSTKLFVNKQNFRYALGVE